MKRVVLCVLASAACSTSPPHFTGFAEGGTGFDFDAGATSSASSRGADGSPAGVDAAPPTPSAHVRFADWVPDAPGGGFSFCVSPHGSQSWMGPFQPQGVAFPGVSPYVTVPPGTYDAQVIAASSSDCTTGVVPPYTDLPSLDDGAYVTLAALGDAMPPQIVDPSMKVAAFVDDEVGAAGQAFVRMINAAPSLQYVSLGTGSRKTNDFRILFATASFGAPATITAGGQMVDGNGYAQLMPLSSVELSVQPLSAGGADVATASHVSLGGGSAATVVVVGGKTGGPPPQIMICDDAAAAHGAASACNVFAH